MKTITLAGLLLVLAPIAVAADQGPPLPAKQVDPVDFLFGQPRAYVGVRGTWVLPGESGDLFDFFRDQLTIDKGDFRTTGVSADVGATLNSRLTVVGGFEFSRASRDSEYRRLIGSDGLPIAQTTRLDAVTLSASMKLALISPGRRISRYAWIPRTVTPFVGAGVDAVQYRLEQKGEFVDFVDRSIFPETFTSQDWAPAGHVFGGVDVRVWKNLYLTGEGRYLWANGELEPDFVGFDGIDLSGFRIGTGVTFVF